MMHGRFSLARGKLLAADCLCGLNTSKHDYTSLDLTGQLQHVIHMHVDDTVPSNNVIDIMKMIRSASW
jgi:hypothetical protein